MTDFICFDMPFILRFYRDFAWPAQARSLVTVACQTFLLPILPMRISSPILSQEWNGHLSKGHPEDMHCIITSPLIKVSIYRPAVNSSCSINECLPHAMYLPSWCVIILTAKNFMDSHWLF